MSEVFARLSALYLAGHAEGPLALYEDPRLKGDETLRPAAVLVAFTDAASPGLLLLHRPSTMRAHPGQIAFPGGAIDAGESAVDAALREANEELGIDPAQVRIVGESDSLSTYSGYSITPVLAVVPADLDIRPNPVEVAQWFEAPADFVFDPGNQVLQWVDWEGERRCYNEIVWQDHRIWGITAALIVNLSRRLNWHD